MAAIAQPAGRHVCLVASVAVPLWDSVLSVVKKVFLTTK